MMLTIYDFFLLLFWAAGFSFLWRIPLLKAERHTPIDPLHISVIVPARNEAENLGRLLRSFDAQGVRPKEVIVVDDHSVDATASVAHRADCRLIRSGAVPDGWLGKPWACWQGAQTAHCDFLLFLDADVFLTANGFTNILAAFSEDTDLVSIQPYHRMQRAYEQLCAYFNIITLAGINAFTLLGSRILPAGAFGPCLMCRRSDYFKMDGHRRVRAEILENMALGRAFVQAGLRVACYGGRGSLEFRMYPHGLKSLWQGFGKSFALGANAVSVVSLFLIVCWVFGAVSLSRHFIQSAISGNESRLMVLAVLDLLYAGQLYWMLRRIGNFRWPTAIFFQIPLLFFLAVFFASIVQTFILRRVRWKDRTVKFRKTA